MKTDRRSRRWLVWLAMTLSGGTLFQAVQIPIPGFTNQDVPGLSCASFYERGVTTSVDFCYLLNCENGFIGGLVQPCGDPNDPEDDLLADCATIGGGGGTTNGGTTDGNTNNQQTN